MLTVGLYTRELSFNKGDIIRIIRQVDPNWFEAELKGKVGLVPSSYIEVLQILQATKVIRQNMLKQWHFDIYYNQCWQLKFVPVIFGCHLCQIMIYLLLQGVKVRNTIRYDSVYLTCSKKLTGSQKL